MLIIQNTIILVIHPPVVNIPVGNVVLQRVSMDLLQRLNVKSQMDALVKHVHHILDMIEQKQHVRQKLENGQGQQTIVMDII